ncbi:MAG: hypothetical protein ABJB01_00850 [Rudaea sp.]
MHVSRSIVFIVSLMLFAVSPLSFAQAGACDSAAHRAFDFWLGDWQVQKPDKTIAGHNTITREYGGCVVHEHYTTEHNYSGESLNIYDAARGVWHQSWVDSGGMLLVLEGGLRDGKMVMQGKSVGKDGKTTKQRITWTPNQDGTVRQFWESTDAQGKWTTAFDGLYSHP